MNRTGRAVVYPAPNAPFEVREYPVRDARAGGGAGADIDVHHLPFGHPLL